MKTPVTHERLQNHLTYSWWKYVLMMVLVIFFWSILFTTTRYRPPEEKKVVVGVYGAGNQTALDAYMEDVRQLLLPDMEEMNTQFIMSDETWGSSVLMTRMTARECDIYLLPKDLFQTYAQQGVFVALEETMPDLVSELESRGISLSRGWRTDSDKAPVRHPVRGFAVSGHIPVSDCGFVLRVHFPRQRQRRKCSSVL